MHYVITISRQFGSGGKEIGKKVAEILNIPCYDKTVNEFTAVKTGFSKQTIENAEDKTPGAFTYGMFSYVKLQPMHDEIFFAQSEVIRNLAAKGPCVLVGRCADCVLSDRKNVLNVFVFAPIEDRVKRVMSRHNVSQEEAGRIIKANDRMRKRYHDHYSDRRWGEAKNYHLTINSTVGVENAANTIAKLVEGLAKKDE
ncbi:MAG TPA: cytidylate kinase-like family protein [Clostridia bacterium]|nr:cytidylate kinase-like family protein [Clostridia bacterium]